MMAMTTGGVRCAPARALAAAQGGRTRRVETPAPRTAEHWRHPARGRPARARAAAQAGHRTAAPRPAATSPDQGWRRPTAASPCWDGRRRCWPAGGRRARPCVGTAEAATTGPRRTTGSTATATALSPRPGAGAGPPARDQVLWDVPRRARKWAHAVAQVCGLLPRAFSQAIVAVKSTGLEALEAVTPAALDRWRRETKGLGDLPRAVLVSNQRVQRALAAGPWPPL
mmetsp:Transcript_64838/g.173818  ORF Transcript_64838/g.173818 Transcript_64838/m.173818 type:complete len:227 (+) Transcript_64838:512-1192(+)